MRGLVFLTACALALASCGLLDGVAAAEKAVFTFHEQYNASAFDAMYAAGADDLRATEARANTRPTLRTERERRNSHGRSQMGKRRFSTTP